MLYLDTSLLVTALTPEAGIAAVQAWLRSQPFDQFTISDWVGTEFSAALSVKVRGKHMTRTEQSTALERFRLFSETSFTRLSILPSDFSAASRFADLSDSGLRAGDALHLAVASRIAARLCTRDKRLADAGSSAGVATTLL